MLSRLSPAAIAAVALLFVVVVFTCALAVMLVRGTPVPDWARSALAPLVTLLVGWVAPSPAAKVTR